MRGFGTNLLSVSIQPQVDPAIRVKEGARKKTSISVFEQFSLILLSAQHLLWCSSEGSFTRLREPLQKKH